MQSSLFVICKPLIHFYIINLCFAIGWFVSPLQKSEHVLLPWTPDTTPLSLCCGVLAFTSFCLRVLFGMKFYEHNSEFLKFSSNIWEDNPFVFMLCIPLFLPHCSVWWSVFLTYFTSPRYPHVWRALSYLFVFILLYSCQVGESLVHCCKTLMIESLYSNEWWAS